MSRLAVVARRVLPRELVGVPPKGSSEAMGKLGTLKSKFAKGHCPGVVGQKGQLCSKSPMCNLSQNGYGAHTCASVLA